VAKAPPGKCYGGERRDREIMKRRRRSRRTRRREKKELEKEDEEGRAVDQIP